MDPISSLLGGLMVGLVLGALGANFLSQASQKKVTDDAKKETERLKQEKLTEAKAEIAKLKADETDELLKLRKEFEKEQRKSTEDLRAHEKRLNKREDLLDRKLHQVERKEQEILELEEKKKAAFESIKNQEAEWESRNKQIRNGDRMRRDFSTAAQPRQGGGRGTRQGHRAERHPAPGQRFRGRKHRQFN
jgi:ribonuclease Y